MSFLHLSPAVAHLRLLAVAHADHVCLIAKAHSVQFLKEATFC